MAFDWTHAEQGDPQAQTERLPEGWHRVRITRIVTHRSTGEPFTSRKGDPQIMAVFADDRGREATQMYTLSDAAAWTLARLLSRIGHDLDTLQEEGVEPRHFADRRFAEDRLLGRAVWAHVTWSEPDDRGRQYSEVTALHEHELPRGVRGQAAATGPTANPASPATRPVGRPAGQQQQFRSPGVRS